MPTERRAFGDRGEALAENFLRAKGFRILARQARVSRLGELDLVALDGPALVFVEVKTRRDRIFGPPEEAVTPGKLRAIVSAAQAWIGTRGWRGAWRIDVVAVEMTDE